MTLFQELSTVQSAVNKLSKELTGTDYLSVPVFIYKKARQDELDGQILQQLQPLCK